MKALSRRVERRLGRAEEAVNDLLELFPEQTTEDAEMALIVQAAEALQRLRDLVQKA